MSFMDAMKNEMLENFNESVTENSAVGYRTTGKALLDINFAVASLRSANESEIVRRFQAAFLENKVLAMKWLFFARDVRGGLGERRLFRTAKMLQTVATESLFPYSANGCRPQMLPLLLLRDMQRSYAMLLR